MPVGHRIDAGIFDHTFRIVSDVTSPMATINLGSPMISPPSLQDSL
jgi:hypothetical protein